MMKKIVMLFVAFLGLTTIYAQQNHDESTSSKSLFEEFTNLKTRAERFHLSLDINGGLDNQFENGEHMYSKFAIRELRIQAKGNVNDWLSYCWRQRLNRSADGVDMIDNLPSSIDVAGLGVRVNNKLSFFVGKQCAAYGGMEFDLNPINVYEYSDMLEHMSTYMTGVNMAYNLNKDHQIQLQVLNSLNESFEKTYNVGNTAVIGSKAPMVYTLNWNGSFLNDKLKTRWSTSLINQAKDKNAFYHAFGNMLSIGNVEMFVDCMYSNEDIDRTGIMSTIINSPNRGDVLDSQYLSLVTKFNYRIAPRWNIFVQGSYETASLEKEIDELVAGRYRTSYGYHSGVEFYPMETNLHFFVTYVGRKFDYADNTSFQDYNTDRVSLGFVYQLPLF